MRRVLIIAGPGIGDIYLSTPLVRSLLRKFPGVRIDYLVRRGREKILLETPGVADVIVYDNRRVVVDYIKMAARIFRRYDLAISCCTSDRATLSCLYAAPRRVGKVPRRRAADAWKRFVLHGWVQTDAQKHTSIENLELMEVLGIAKDYRAILPARGLQERCLEQGGAAYAVLHCAARGDHKLWPAARWRELIAALAEWEIEVVLTGGASPAEKSLLEEISRGFNRVHTAAGVKFADALTLLGKARFFLGVDTCMAHLAASCGAPTFVLIGPTNAAKWAPLPPSGFAGGVPPLAGRNAVNDYENVHIIRGKCGCIGFPERCSRTRTQYSRCLERISVDRVLERLAGAGVLAPSTLHGGNKPQQSSDQHSAERLAAPFFS